MLKIFFFFKQKTAYEMRISDWSSDVCSSDLRPEREREMVDAGNSLIAITKVWHITDSKSVMLLIVGNKCDHIITKHFPCIEKIFVEFDLIAKFTCLYHEVHKRRWTNVTIRQ